MTVVPRQTAGRGSGSDLHPYPTKGCIMLRTTVLAFAGLAGLAMAARPTPGNNVLGLNAGWVNDWDGNNAFADIMVHAREWQNPSWDDTVALDEDGWPLADASTVIFHPSNDTGSYHLSFQGSAESIEPMWYDGTVDSVRHDAATNLTTARIRLPTRPANSAGLVLRGTRRTPSSPLGSGFRNARLWRPGYPVDGSKLFTDEYLAQVSIGHITRFMDWGVTNINPARTWEHRRRPGSADRNRPMDGIKADGGRGMSIEHMVALCNASRTDLWINIPIRADSDFVVKAMRVVRNGSDGVEPYSSTVTDPVYPPLDPDLKVYVELGNEIWNSAFGFMDHVWFQQLYNQETRGNRSHPVFFDGTTDAWIPYFRYFGHLNLRMSRAVHAAVDESEWMSRFRPVIMGQLGFSQMLAPALEYVEQVAAPVKAHFYGGGGTAYYGAEEWSGDPATFFTAGNLPQREFSAQLESDAVLVSAYGIRRLAYEGGPGLDGMGPAANEEEKWALLEDPRMASVIVAGQDSFSAYGGEALVYYTIGNDADFGFTPDWKHLGTGKLQGLRDLAARPKAPSTLGCVAPCTTFASRKPDGVGKGYYWNGIVGTDTLLAGFDPGDWRAFPFTIPRSGRYLMTLKVSSPDAGRGVLWSAGVPVDTFDVPSGISEGLHVLPSTAVDLDEGPVGFRVQGLSGSDFALHSLALVPDPTFVSVSPTPRSALPRSGPDLRLLDRIRYRIHQGRVHGLDGKRH